MCFVCVLLYFIYVTVAAVVATQCNNFNYYSGQKKNEVHITFL